MDSLKKKKIKKEEKKENTTKNNYLSFEWIEAEETFTTRAQEWAMAWTF